MSPKGEEALVNEIITITKTTPESLLSVFTMWGHNYKSAICKQREDSHQNLTCVHPDLRLPASRTVRSNFLSSMSYLDYDILL